MGTPAPALPHPKTLSDLYPDGLSQAQARRIVALLGLATPRRTKPSDSENEAA